MRRMPLPQTDGGPEPPSIGYAQQDIVSRAQALWATFQPLYQQLAFAFAVGDDRRFKRLIKISIGQPRLANALGTSPS
jgi:hypothetical protein